jgi:hypothetical protein
MDDEIVKKLQSKEKLHKIFLDLSVMVTDKK